MKPQIYTFEATCGGTSIKIEVVAKQTSTAWTIAVERACRMGPFAMSALKLVESKEAPEEISKYYDFF